MILIGIDDTDSPDSRGTNQLAKTLVRTVLADLCCLRIVRHQLLFDDRVPYTSKNGSASIWLDRDDASLDELFRTAAGAMQREFIDGSDPGLCVIRDVPDQVVRFGRRVQQDLVTIDEARCVAQECGLLLEGLGGTNGGVIGALAAVGLAATGDDGRVVHRAGYSDSISGVRSLSELIACGVTVTERETRAAVTGGRIDVGKKLRPNLRGGCEVLYVDRAPANADCEWTAVKLT